MTLSCFKSLKTAEDLQLLDAQFQRYLAGKDNRLAEQLIQYRAHQLSAIQESDWMIATAPVLEGFISELFEIQSDVKKLFDETVACNLAFVDKKKNTRLYHPVTKKDYTNLVPLVPVENDSLQRLQGPCETHRERDGFGLTDPRMSRAEVMDEIDYCVYCHKNEGDFCSKGFPVKKSSPELGFKINPAGDLLAGCPLEEKISEMHTVKKNGFGIGALAIVTIDNPLCAVTGHRICNDCMKACIYQKQDPVNIPEVETRVLTDVLDLPWGVEIYDLLIRWNPLRKTQFSPKNYNHKKILVTGMGPAGFTLAHHLLMEGCAVVGSDGLKIEPLPKHFIENPIRDFNVLKESLDNRIMSGFGGVSEYGITVRWDKNFLKLIYLSLMRRSHFQLIGGLRFGGTVTVESAWQLGFDHISIAVGAGLPRELSIKNSLAPGMRSANDFLMALQLTGAIKKSSLANLQMRLPAVVIGGGLTGVDAATEAQAYYIVQVEKMHQRYHILKSVMGEDNLRSQFDVQGLSILDEFLSHAEKIITERQQSKPALNKLIREWGGVTIAYRKSIQESPAYQRNHEELIKAFEEGIFYAEGLEPASAVLDEHGDCAALICNANVQDESGLWQKSTEQKTIPAKSIFVATGAKPNIAYEFEHKGTFERDNNNYRCFDENKHPVDHIGNVKENFGIFTSDPRVSFLGDTHPVFHGSVVKAIASAQKGYPKIMCALSVDGQFIASDYAQFRNTIEHLFTTTLTDNIRHTENIVELIVHAPMLAKQHTPGQFYRLQNFETYAKKIDDTTLQTETVAALGIYYKNKPDHLSFFIVEKGASTKILGCMKKGDAISVMGPTGAKIKIPEVPQPILMIGNEMAIMYLLATGETLKQAGHSIHFVGIMSEKNRFALDQISKIADSIEFCEKDSAIVETRFIASRDARHAKHIFIIGSPQLLKTMRALRQTYFSKDTAFTASVYGSMQCMLKGVCAQCLQWQIDPVTGKRTKAVYACSWQYQPMDIIDIDNISERQGQNRVQEILTNLWMEYLLGAVTG
ncbi:MAG: FAD-dependent oxidoreductase [Coxiellaceae bacterium]|nr:FAD-dependent oxidoreductase [Coxiellaceae bacterium]